MGCGGSKDAAGTPPRTTTRTGAPADAAAKPAATPAAQKELPSLLSMELEGPCDTKGMVKSMLDKVFDQCDVNNDGNISREELTAQLDKLLASTDTTLTGKNVKTLVAESGLNPFLNIFDQLDVNKDGKITKQEFKDQLAPARASKVVSQLLKEVFDKIDKNGDGDISREELSGAYDKLLNTVEERSGKNWTTLMVDAGLNPDFHVFEQLDTNNDGKISWEEFNTKLKKPTVPWVAGANGGDTKAMVAAMLDQVFDRCDVDGDDNITRQELTSQWELVLQSDDKVNGKDVKTMVAESGLNPFMNLFDQLDANHDGKISREEFREQLKPAGAAKTVEQLLKQIFDGIDANGDGNIDREELSTAYQKLLTSNEEKSGKNWITLVSDAGLNPNFYVFEEMDADHDGKVTWDEFKTQLSRPETPWVMGPWGGNSKEMVTAMLNQVFDRCDVNGDGNISREELASCWETVLNSSDTITDKSVKQLVAESGLNPFMTRFDQLDANHDGKISREEFQEVMKPASAAKTLEQLLKEVFDRIDKNGDGDLSRDELTAAYATLVTTKEETSGKDWKTLLEDAGMSPYFHVFEELDSNNDGKITWAEFSAKLKPDNVKIVEISAEVKDTGCCI